jgi:hypothetical protein
MPQHIGSPSIRNVALLIELVEARRLYPGAAGGNSRTMAIRSMVSTPTAERNAMMLAMMPTFCLDGVSFSWADSHSRLVSLPMFVEGKQLPKNSLQHAD